MTRVELMPSYILHTRSYKNTSLLLTVLTEACGIVDLQAKGAKRPASRWYSLMQPFLALQLSWVGKGELKTLTQAESHGWLPQLVGEKVLLGLYVNELLVRLFRKEEVHTSLFCAYNEILHSLAQLDNHFAQQWALRIFEKRVLSELGYGLDLRDVKTGESVLPDLLYYYEPGVGIIEASHQPFIKAKVSFSGASILALEQEACHCEKKLREVKRFMRFILSYYLGNKTLYSRTLFYQKHKGGEYV